MPLAFVGLACAALFLLAFRFYGLRVARRYQLSATAKTPAERFADGVDFVPTKRPILLAQHFASIAAAGPVVGPITAGLYFGWGPSLLWIVFGTIFIGAIHDFSSLVASIKHDAKSLPELARQYLGPQAYALVMTFIWLSLVYVVIAFTDVTAQAFVARETWGDTQHDIGGGVATSSLLYLLLSVLLGLALTKWRVPLWLATLLFFPALVGIIVWGQLLPITFAVARPAVLWGVIILAYCAVASVLPMWLLLQPRGYLGGYFLYIVLAFGLLGVIFGGYKAEYPAFLAWRAENLGTLYPFLFITIACGACSGFHGLVCSGTTCKQLHKETHAPLVGYGGMLLEGVVAVMALMTVMMWPAGAAELKKSPSEIYAGGIAHFVHAVLGLPREQVLAFGMLAFTTFVYDTLDVATRLGRYLMEELLGLKGRRGKWLATGITLGLPLAYLLLGANLQDALGAAKPVWLVVWPLFGSSNQLLAGLTFLLLAAWFRARHRWAPWLVLPGFFMFGTTAVALVIQSWRALQRSLGGQATAIDLVNLTLALALLATAAAFLAFWLRRLGRPLPPPV
ncbi:carbon starvation protein A [bacterium]|nr:carbon starvation protein A [bacterium]